MVQCPKCKTEILPDSAFCGKCGMEISIPTESKPPIGFKLDNFIGKEVYVSDSVMIGHVNDIALDKTLTTVEMIFVKRGLLGPELWFEPDDIDHIEDAIFLRLSNYQVAVITAAYKMAKSLILENLKGNMTEQALYEIIKPLKLMSIEKFRFVLHLLLSEGKITKSGNTYKRK
jgi:sporulation protein YlmC with PRC-barrel domain